MLGLYYMPMLLQSFSVQMVYHTHIYFECSIRVCFTYIYTLYFKLPKMFYLSQLFINSMFAFLLQELQYIYYIISHTVSTPKNNF